jgi:hypothetical protein
MTSDLKRRVQRLEQEEGHGPPVWIVVNTDVDGNLTMDGKPITEAEIPADPRIGVINVVSVPLRPEDQISEEDERDGSEGE